MRKLFLFLSLLSLSVLSSAQVKQATVLQWQQQQPQSKPPAGTVYMYFDQTGTFTCLTSTGSNACSGGGGGGSVTHTVGALTAGAPILGNGSGDIFAAGAELWVTNQSTGATADAKINSVATAAVAAGIYNIVVSFIGAQTLASQPLAGTGFHGYIKILPGAQYSCTMAVNLPCFPVPEKVTVDGLVTSAGATSSSFTSGGSYLKLTNTGQIAFCLGSQDGSTCPSAGSTQAQASAVKNMSVHGNNLAGVIAYQNYEAEENSGFFNVIAVAVGNGYACADIGGGQGGAINSSIDGLNCSNSQSVATAAVATYVGLLVNPGASGFGPREIKNVSVTNGCSAALGSCTGGANAQPNYNAQFCGFGGGFSAKHLETYAVAGVLFGQCYVPGSPPTLSAITTGGWFVSSVDSNGGHDVVRISNAGTVTNIELHNIATNVAGNPVNDQNHTVITLAGAGGVTEYATDSTGAVLIDSSYTNPSAFALLGLANTFTAANTFQNVTINQNSNGNDALLIIRHTDSATTGNFINFKNHSLASSLFSVDVLGNASGLTFTTIGTTTGLLGLGGSAGGDPSLPTNSVGFIAPANASFTSWFARLPTTAPSGTQYLGCGTPSSNVSTCTWNNVASAESSLTGSTAATTITETGIGFAITRAGVETTNLAAPYVFSNLNSTNNNTSITLGVTSPGTSTGQTTLNVNGASTGGDLIDAGTGGSWAAGVLSGQTIKLAFTPGGQLKLNAGNAITAGTGSGINLGACGTAPTGVSSTGMLYCNTDLQLHAMSGTTDNGIIATKSQTAQITGADWTCGTGGTVSSCVTAQTIGTLTFTLPLIAANWTMDCQLIVGQATGATANNWNLQTATNGATNTEADYTQNTAAAVIATGVVTGQGSTTTTFNIGGAWTQGATGTKMPVHIHATIEGASASGTVLNLQLVAPTIADLVTIYRGSSCRIF